MWLEATILGIIEGLTEFLPISSTGHLIIANTFLSFNDKSFTDAFNIIIQVGAILSVLFYFKDFFIAKIKEKNYVYLWKIGIAFIPSALIGFFFGSYLMEILFSIISVAIALIVGGIVLLFADKLQKESSINNIDELSYKKSFFIGIIQCFSFWPGISRAGSAIIGGLTNGLSREFAAEFSFLLAVPTLVGASLYEFIQYDLSFTSNQLLFLAIGIIISFIVALIVVKLFISYLKKYTMKPFAIYRIILGILLLIFFV